MQREAHEHHDGDQASFPSSHCLAMYRTMIMYRMRFLRLLLKGLLALAKVHTSPSPHFIIKRSPPSYFEVYEFIMPKAS